jgi:hypothetical protein
MAVRRPQAAFERERSGDEPLRCNEDKKKRNIVRCERHGARTHQKVGRGIGSISTIMYACLEATTMAALARFASMVRHPTLTTP